MAHVNVGDNEMKSACCMESARSACLRWSQRGSTFETAFNGLRESFTVQVCVALSAVQEQANCATPGNLELE